MPGFSKEMMEALEADGEKLRQLTGEDHGPVFLVDCICQHVGYCDGSCQHPAPASCEACDGRGYTVHHVTVFEHGCGFSHDDTHERRCADCDGTGLIKTWES